MIKFINLKDSLSSALYGCSFLAPSYSATLAADFQSSLLIPDGAEGCLISATGDYFVGYDSSLSLPSSSTFTEVKGCQNRSIILLENIYKIDPFIEPTSLYFIARASTDITVEFFLV